jgi:hypothetical protein
LDGAEIDKIIWDVEARKALAIEIGGARTGVKRELAANYHRDVQ